MQPDIDNLKDRLEQNRDYLANLTEKLPGYKGWGLQDKKERYEVDRILREFMSMRIQDYKIALNRLSSALFSKNTPEFISNIESINNEFERVLKKCQHADYAKPASFSNLKISEDDEYKLLEYDWRLLQQLDIITKLIASLESGDEASIENDLKQCQNEIRNFEKKFDDRKYNILEVM